MIVHLIDGRVKGFASRGCRVKRGSEFGVSPFFFHFDQNERAEISFFFESDSVIFPFSRGVSEIGVVLTRSRPLI